MSIQLTEITTSVTHKVTTDTVNPTYTIPFQYLSKGHVHVFLDNTELTESLTGYQYLSKTSIQIMQTVPANSYITIIRHTPYDEQLVEWHDGNVLLSDDMNLADLQMLFVLQEIKDPYNIDLKIINDLFAIVSAHENKALQLYNSIFYDIVGPDAAHMGWAVQLVCATALQMKQEEEESEEAD